MTLTTDQVWKEMDSTIFGVLAFVNPKGEPRSAGVCYVVDGRSLLIASGRDTWKVRHLESNPNVSMTVTVPKRVPFMPFIKVPAATITFSGKADLVEVADVDQDALSRLTRGLELDRDAVRDTVMIRVTPRDDFVTYGVAMPMMRMRRPEQARGRASCGTEEVVGV